MSWDRSSLFEMGENNNQEGDQTLRLRDARAMPTLGSDCSGPTSCCIFSHLDPPQVH